MRARLNLHRVLEGIEHKPGPVLFTLVDKSRRMALEESDRRLSVTCPSVLDPVVNLSRG